MYDFRQNGEGITGFGRIYDRPSFWRDLHGQVNLFVGENLCGNPRGIMIIYIKKGSSIGKNAWFFQVFVSI